ncbi:MAG: hypothetical protein AAFX99_35790, partial [Myxococcota bacterium]
MAVKRESAGVATEDDMATLSAYDQNSNQGTIVTLVVVAILIAAVALVVSGYPRWGVAVGGCGIIIAGIVWAVLDPPRPRQQSPDSAAIDFGRTNKDR